MVEGLFCPLRGLRFIAHHLRLLWLIAIPFVINTLLFSFFIWVIASNLSEWLDKLLPARETWYFIVLFYILMALLVVALVLVVIFAFTIVGNIILGPFNDLISEKVEFLYTGQGHDEPFRLKALLADPARSIKGQIGKLIFYLAVLAALLALNLIPLIGQLLSGILIMLHTLFFLGWEYVDYSMERRKFSLRLKLKTGFKNFSSFIGLGAGVSLMLLIPLANLLAIPLCAVGGTLLFCDLKKKGRVPEPGGENVNLLSQR